MKTLSILNPLAYLVAAGLKDVENRTWKTEYRGPLLIHASGSDIKAGWSPDFSAWPHLAITEEYARANLGTLDFQTAKYYGPDADSFTLKVDPESLTDQERRERYLFNTSFRLGMKGKVFYASQSIVGMVDLVDIVTKSESPWAEKESPYYWILKNAKFFRVPFLYVKGRLNLWDFDHPELQGREVLSAGG